MTTKTLPTDRNYPARIEIHQQGVWGEETTQEGLRTVTFRRPLPMQLIRTYAETAARHAVARRLEDGSWWAEIEGFPGVWANEPSQKEALDVLEEVVFEWVILKLRDEDRDLPVLDSLDLNGL
jgi:predicted RNase H-like HicB family nuclease